jgi:predicted phosphoribosyltransferase
VAFEIAAEFGVPLDIIVVKKLRAPASPELAIGAVCADGQQVLHEATIRDLNVGKAYLERELRLRLAEARETELRYRGEHLPVPIAGAAVLLVDDGIATGATMEAALLSARSRGVERIAVATPVASPEAYKAMQAIADDVICLETPELFWAVGHFYRNFWQVSDEEVQQLLELSHAHPRTGR